MAAVEDVAEKEADEGVGPGLAALSDAEDDELDQLGGLDGQHLVLEHQQHLADDLLVLLEGVQVVEEGGEELVELLGDLVVVRLVPQRDDFLVLNEGGSTSGKGLCTQSSARTSSVSKLTRFSMMISKKSMR